MNAPTIVASLVAVDGRDALAYVIVKPGPSGNVVIDAAANGLSKAAAAAVLRHVAEQWDPLVDPYLADEVSVRWAQTLPDDPVVADEDAAG